MWRPTEDGMTRALQLGYRTWEYRPLAFFNVVYNHRGPVSGLTTVPRPIESRQFLVKWTWLLQL
jgi:hypothetical protein